MTISSIIEACENVSIDEDVMVVFKVIDEDTGRVDTFHRVKEAVMWILSDISREEFDDITFKIIGDSLIIKVRCYKKGIE